MLDIRLPIGLMFVVKGIILALYGLLSNSAQYSVSLGINVNLIWGAAMLVFGIAMLALAKYLPERTAEAPVVEVVS